MDGLYNTDILTLAATIEHLGQLQAPQGSARKVSKLCGSWVEVDVNMDGETVSKFAIRLQACALGQAACSIMARNIIGSSPEELQTLRDQVFAMLKEGGEPPNGKWADIAALQPVKDFKARHASTLLVFDAVCEAVGQQQ